MSASGQTGKTVLIDAGSYTQTLFTASISKIITIIGSAESSVQLTTSTSGTVFTTSCSSSPVRFEKMTVYLAGSQFITNSGAGDIEFASITFRQPSSTSTLTTNIFSSSAGKLRFIAAKFYSLTVSVSLIRISPGHLWFTDNCVFDTITSTSQSSVFSTNLGGSSTLYVEDTTFISCSSHSDGGVICSHPSDTSVSTFLRTNFSKCFATGDGGAAWICLHKTSSLTMDAVTFDRCESQKNGGGLYFRLYDGTPNFVIGGPGGILFDNCRAGNSYKADNFYIYSRIATSTAFTLHNLELVGEGNSGASSHWMHYDAQTSAGNLPAATALCLLAGQADIPTNYMTYNNYGGTALSMLSLTSTVTVTIDSTASTYTACQSQKCPSLSTAAQQTNQSPTNAANTINLSGAQNFHLVDATGQANFLKTAAIRGSDDASITVTPAITSDLITLGSATGTCDVTLKIISVTFSVSAPKENNQPIPHHLFSLSSADTNFMWLTLDSVTVKSSDSSPALLSKAAINAEAGKLVMQSVLFSSLTVADQPLLIISVHYGQFAVRSLTKFNRITRLQCPEGRGGSVFDITFNETASIFPLKNVNFYQCLVGTPENEMYGSVIFIDATIEGRVDCSHLRFTTDDMDGNTLSDSLSLPSAQDTRDGVPFVGVSCAEEYALLNAELFKGLAGIDDPSHSHYVFHCPGKPAFSFMDTPALYFVGVVNADDSYCSKAAPCTSVSVAYNKNPSPTQTKMIKLRPEVIDAGDAVTLTSEVQLVGLGEECSSLLFSSLPQPAFTVTSAHEAVIPDVSIRTLTLLINLEQSSSSPLIQLVSENSKVPRLTMDSVTISGEDKYSTASSITCAGLIDATDGYLEMNSVNIHHIRLGNTPLLSVNLVPSSSTSFFSLTDSSFSEITRADTGGSVLVSSLSSDEVLDLSSATFTNCGSSSKQPGALGAALELTLSSTPGTFIPPTFTYTTSSVLFSHILYHATSLDLVLGSTTTTAPTTTTQDENAPEPDTTENNDNDNEDENDNNNDNEDENGNDNNDETTYTGLRDYFPDDLEYSADAEFAFTVIITDFYSGAASHLFKRPSWNPTLTNFYVLDAGFSVDAHPSCGWWDFPCTTLASSLPTNPPAGATVYLEAGTQYNTNSVAASLQTSTTISGRGIQSTVISLSDTELTTTGVISVSADENDVNVELTLLSFALLSYQGSAFQRPLFSLHRVDDSLSIPSLTLTSIAITGTLTPPDDDDSVVLAPLVTSLIIASDGHLTLNDVSFNSILLHDIPLLKVPCGSNELSFTGTNKFTSIVREEGDGAVINEELTSSTALSITNAIFIGCSCSKGAGVLAFTLPSDPSSSFTDSTLSIDDTGASPSVLFNTDASTPIDWSSPSSSSSPCALLFIAATGDLFKTTYSDQLKSVANGWNTPSTSKKYYGTISGKGPVVELKYYLLAPTDNTLYLNTAGYSSSSHPTCGWDVIPCLTLTDLADTISANPTQTKTIKLQSKDGYTSTHILAGDGFTTSINFDGQYTTGKKSKIEQDTSPFFLSSMNTPHTLHLSDLHIVVASSHGKAVDNAGTGTVEMESLVFEQTDASLSQDAPLITTTASNGQFVFNGCMFTGIALASTPLIVAPYSHLSFTGTMTSFDSVTRDDGNGAVLDLELTSDGIDLSNISIQDCGLPDTTADAFGSGLRLVVDQSSGSFNPPTFTTNNPTGFIKQRSALVVNVDSLNLVESGKLLSSNISPLSSDVLSNTNQWVDEKELKVYIEFPLEDSDDTKTTALTHLTYAPFFKDPTTTVLFVSPDGFAVDGCGWDDLQCSSVALANTIFDNQKISNGIISLSRSTYDTPSLLQCDFAQSSTLQGVARDGVIISSVPNMFTVSKNGLKVTVKQMSVPSPQHTFANCKGNSELTLADISFGSESSQTTLSSSLLVASDGTLCISHCSFDSFTFSETSLITQSNSASISFPSTDGITTFHDITRLKGMGVIADVTLRAGSSINLEGAEIKDWKSGEGVLCAAVRMVVDIGGDFKVGENTFVNEEEDGKWIGAERCAILFEANNVESMKSNVIGTNLNALLSSELEHVNEKNDKKYYAKLSGSTDAHPLFHYLRNPLETEIEDETIYVSENGEDGDYCGWDDIPCSSLESGIGAMEKYSGEIVSLCSGMILNDGYTSTSPISESLTITGQQTGIIQVSSTTTKSLISIGESTIETATIIVRDISILFNAATKDDAVEGTIFKLGDSTATTQRGNEESSTITTYPSLLTIMQTTIAPTTGHKTAFTKASVINAENGKLLLSEVTIHSLVIDSAPLIVFGKYSSSFSTLDSTAQQTKTRQVKNGEEGANDDNTKTPGTGDEDESVADSSSHLDFSVYFTNDDSAKTQLRISHCSFSSLTLINTALLSSQSNSASLSFPSTDGISTFTDITRLNGMGVIADVPLLSGLLLDLSGAEVKDWKSGEGVLCAAIRMVVDIGGDFKVGENTFVNEEEDEKWIGADHCAIIFEANSVESMKSNVIGTNLNAILSSELEHVNEKNDKKYYAKLSNSKDAHPLFHYLRNPLETEIQDETIHVSENGEDGDYCGWDDIPCSSLESGIGVMMKYGGEIVSLCSGMILNDGYASTSPISESMTITGQKTGIIQVSSATTSSVIIVGESEEGVEVSVSDINIHLKGTSESDSVGGSVFKVGGTSSLRRRNDDESSTTSPSLLAIVRATIEPSDGIAEAYTRASLIDAENGKLLLAGVTFRSIIVDSVPLILMGKNTDSITLVDATAQVTENNNKKNEQTVEEKESTSPTDGDDTNKAQSSSTDTPNLTIIPTTFTSITRLHGNGSVVATSFLSTDIPSLKYTAFRMKFANGTFIKCGCNEGSGGAIAFTLPSARSTLTITDCSFTQCFAHFPVVSSSSSTTPILLSSSSSSSSTPTTDLITTDEGSGGAMFLLLYNASSYIDTANLAFSDCQATYGRNVFILSLDYSVNENFTSDLLLSLFPVESAAEGDFGAAISYPEEEEEEEEDNGSKVSKSGTKTNPVTLLIAGIVIFILLISALLLICVLCYLCKGSKKKKNEEEEEKEGLEKEGDIVEKGKSPSLETTTTSTSVSNRPMPQSATKESKKRRRRRIGGLQPSSFTDGDDYISMEDIDSDTDSNSENEEPFVHSSTYSSADDEDNEGEDKEAHPTSVTVQSFLNLEELDLQSNNELNNTTESITDINTSPSYTTSPSHPTSPSLDSTISIVPYAEDTTNKKKKKKKKKKKLVLVRRAIPRNEEENKDEDDEDSADLPLLEAASPSLPRPISGKSTSSSSSSSSSRLSSYPLLSPPPSLPPSPSSPSSSSEENHPNQQQKEEDLGERVINIEGMDTSSHNTMGIISIQGPSLNSTSSDTEEDVPVETDKKKKKKKKKKLMVTSNQKEIDPV